MKQKVVCRVGISCGSPQARANAANYAAMGYLVINGDEFRNWELANGHPNFNVNRKVLRTLREGIFAGRDIYVDCDHSTWPAMLVVWRICFGRGVELSFVSLQQTATGLYEWLDLTSPEDLELSLPYYFQNHPSPAYKDFPSGAARGKQVAQGEIDRFLKTRFKTGPDGYLVPLGIGEQLMGMAKRQMKKLIG